MRHAALFAAAVAALPLPALAQETASGSITGTIDLDSASWFVAGQDLDPGSAWTEDESGRHVTVVGYPEQVAEESGAGAIEISFQASGNPSGLVAANRQITFRPDDPDVTLLADEENVDLTLTALHVEGDEMAVSGSFVATMTPGGTEGLVIDAPEAVTVDGNFQATIYRAD